MLKLWRRLFSAKRPFKLTKAGWVFILYTIGVGAGAINTGNNLLYLVFGVFLGLILASGFLSDLSLWGMDVDWTFPETAQAGQPMAILLRITNRKKYLPSLSVSVAMDGLLNGKILPLRVYVPFAAAGQTVMARLEFLPPERGWFQVKGIRLHTRYPFALLEKWWRVYREEDAAAVVLGDPESGFFVTPAAVSVQSAHVSTSQFQETPEAPPQERGEGPTFYGVRPFRQGDNPRRIHWKSSAKNAPEILVREMESEKAFDVLVECPGHGRLSQLTAGDQDKFISFLASLVQRFESEGHATQLVFQGNAVLMPEKFLAVWDPSQEWSAQPWSAVFDFRPIEFRSGMRTLDGWDVYLRWREGAR